jgi:nitroimidazol reductase NimA-like FMN-containing flavoprotein (pyridoxamine 5'-phosphate oxidase superfamily)
MSRSIETAAEAATESRPRSARVHARHHVQRTKARANYDRDVIHAILDAGLIAHVGFCVDGQPFVIPMLYARDGETILLHGSIASRLVNALGGGMSACLSVTHVDGLVLARSHFHHSVNYRSVVAFGVATIVEDADEKVAALAHFVDAMIPGRAAESRAPDGNELAATHVLRFEIEDASAKVREGGAKDDPADAALPHWAGVVPQRAIYDTPLVEPTVANTSLPQSVQRLLAARSARA